MAAMAGCPLGQQASPARVDNVVVIHLIATRIAPGPRDRSCLWGRNRGCRVRGVGSVGWWRNLGISEVRKT